MDKQTETRQQRRIRRLRESGLVKKEVWIYSGDKRAIMTLNLIDRRGDIKFEVKK